MTLAEDFALGNMLSSWPPKWSYHRIITTILEDRDTTKVVIWEPFEHDHPERIVEIIENLKDDTNRLLKHQESLLREKLTKKITKLLR